MVFFSHCQQVVLGDTDAINVNHASYERWVAAALDLFFLEADPHFKEEVNSGAMKYVVRQATIDHKAQGRYGDRIIINLTLKKLKQASFKFQFEVKKLDEANEVMLAIGSRQVVFLDSREKMARVPRIIKEVLAPA